MTTRANITLIVLSTVFMATRSVGMAHAQEARLETRLADPARTQVNRMLDSARAADLPTEPLVDRALEGAAKGAPPELIVAAVGRLWDELRTARDALGTRASVGELTAGASALRAGASDTDLRELRARRGTQPLTVAAAVLADLVAAGVPSDTAIVAVLSLARAVDDAQYVAFRRNVERDIALGASPSAALGVRLDAARAELASADHAADRLGDRATRPDRKRKP